MKEKRSMFTNNEIPLKDFEKAGLDIDEASLPAPGLIVTPRDIDRSARDAAKLVGYAINLALHEGLSVEDIDMLLG